MLVYSFFLFTQKNIVRTVNRSGTNPINLQEFSAPEKYKQTGTDAIVEIRRKNQDCLITPAMSEPIERNSDTYHKNNMLFPPF